MKIFLLDFLFKQFRILLITKMPCSLPWFQRSFSLFSSVTQKAQLISSLFEWAHHQKRHTHRVYNNKIPLWGHSITENTIFSPSWKFNKLFFSLKTAQTASTSHFLPALYKLLKIRFGACYPARKNPKLFWIGGLRENKQWIEEKLVDSEPVSIFYFAISDLRHSVMLLEKEMRKYAV